MLSVLRVIGTVNAAVWFGATVFFTFAAGPAFFSEAMLKLLGRPHAGAAAQIVLERYFLLHHWCGLIALAHLSAEWLYAGKPLSRFRLALLLTLFGLGLLGGYWLQPKMHKLHMDWYGARSTPAMRERAQKSFGLWHGVAQGSNLLVLAGVLVYFWQVTHPEGLPRFKGQNKFADKFRG
ncbi:MAG: DUF4149 domain-containing protein [Verrucomicrobia bacterium]|nr:DUF4149 domain-containing protein [Verrucomicrobiota bacterium]